MVRGNTRLGNMRRRLGRLKYRLQLASIGRIRELEAREMRGEADRWLRLLKPLSPAGPARTEVHLLCGKSQLDMGIWSSWSLMRFLPGCRLLIHGDSTLRSADLSEWRSIIPDLIFVSFDEASTRAKAALAGLPWLERWHRTHNITARKIADVHFVGSSSRIILLDSDVLCFRPPIAMLERLEDDQISYIWNPDIDDCYAANSETLFDVTKVRPVARFNSGFASVPRLNAEGLQVLDRLLQRLAADERIDFNHFWMEQTLYALLAAGAPGSFPLPREYAVVRGRAPRSQVIRHYVGLKYIRPLFYTEGVRRLREQLRTDS
jgi:hypothetical protein